MELVISNSGTSFGSSIFLRAPPGIPRLDAIQRRVIMRMFRIAVSAFLAGETLFANAREQKPLTRVDELPGSNFEVREQSPDLCDAGSRQWTGTVNVTADKSMFFCAYSQSQRQWARDSCC